MTAAPGPQQPDEVFRGDDLPGERMCRFCEDWCHRSDGGHNGVRARPAAPSAQPDEVCGVRYPDSTEGYCPCARVSCDGRHRCLHGTTWGTPAQPVRDTEEGRR